MAGKRRKTTGSPKTPPKSPKTGSSRRVPIAPGLEQSTSVEPAPSLQEQEQEQNDGIVQALSNSSNIIEPPIGPVDPNDPPIKMPKTYSAARMLTILESIEGGLTLTHTLRVLGLTRVFAYWREKTPKFIDALIARAESVFIKTNIARINKAGQKYWQANAWLLERRFPSQFSQQRGVPGKGGDKIGPVNIVFVSSVPRPYKTIQNRSRQFGERGKGPEEVENENNEIMEIIDANAKIITNIPRRSLPEGNEE